MPKRKRERWTTRQAAAHCGCAPMTFRSYVNTGRAPQPLPDEFGERGERIFLADEIRRWHAGRDRVHYGNYDPLKSAAHTSKEPPP